MACPAGGSFFQRQKGTEKGACAAKGGGAGAVRFCTLLLDGGDLKACTLRRPRSAALCGGGRVAVLRCICLCRRVRCPHRTALPSFVFRPSSAACGV